MMRRKLIEENETKLNNEEGDDTEVDDEEGDELTETIRFSQ